MSMLKRIVVVGIASLFLAGLFAGCAPKSSVKKYNTKWDPNKMQYVNVK